MATLSAEEASRVLGQVAGYGESLTRRTHGLTTMVWGLAAATVFLTYGSADPYLEDVVGVWVFAVLWMPPVAAATWFTRALWRAHTVTWEPASGHVTRTSLGLVALFLAVAASLFLGLDILLGIEWSVYSLMTMANGVLAILMLAHPFLRTCPRGQLGAGLGMIGLGVALGAFEAPPQAAALWGALGTGAAWFCLGSYEFRKG